MNMKHVDYTLTEGQVTRLKEISAKTGLSSSELIRRLLDEWFEKLDAKLK